MPPPPYAPSPYGSAAPGFPGGPGWVAPVTSGLAIASLVLAILWLGGLGSILAVIFGIIALSKIKQSQGRNRGSGLAIAGLVIGGLGVLGSIGFYAGVVAVTNTYGTRTLQLGQTGTYSASENDSVVAITVDSVTRPFTSTDQSIQPTSGDEFAVALVKECAGPDGSPNGPSALGWQLNLAHGTTVGSTSDAKSPGIDSFNAIAASQCVTGYITFVLPKGSVPSSIEYYGASVHSYDWVLK